MKKNKGFTLVELLAVIVILAIIMIIAIPAVLNTMETAKKKSMVNFAQKVINELSKQYVSRMTFDGYIRPADNTYIIFDIAKDLGLTNTGEYYGVAAIQLLKDDKGEEFTYYDIELFSNEYALNFNTHSENGVKKELNVDSIVSISVIDSMLPEGVKLKELPYKQINVAATLKSTCKFFDEAYVDGVSNTQMYCTRKANPRSDFSGNGKCKGDTALENSMGEIINKYLNGQELISCPLS